MTKNHKKEELKIFDSYINENNRIELYDETITEEQINEINNNMIQFEKPDIYSHIDNELIMIEHFEFDSYKKNKDGSDYRQKEGIINYKFKEKLEKGNGKIIRYDDSITPTASVENYINNFMNSFDEHYKKIDEYKKSKEFKDYNKIHTWFFIEDVSPLVVIILLKIENINR